jgi:uncharacterized protein YegL
VKNIKKTILIALGFSVTVHIVFFAVTPHIYLSGMNRFMEDTRKRFRINKVNRKAEEVSLSSNKKKPARKVRMSGRKAPSGYKFMKKMEVESLPGEDMSLVKKKDRMNNEKIKTRKLPELKLSDILKTEAEKARKDAEPDKRSIADELAGEGHITVKEEVLEYTDAYNTQVELSYPAVSETGSLYSTYSGLNKSGPGNAAAGSYPGPPGKYEDIGEYIDILLSKYIDPITGEKFFKLLIRVKDGIRLEVMPKEIIFLIDSSKSITEKKLAFLKRSLKKILSELNELDRFNLVAFRGDIIKFRDKPIEPSETIIEEAAMFIDDLEAVGQTDVENALYGISAEPITMYPSYLMLLSDGRPTAGIMDSRRIIQQITKKNNKERPIFSFAGGSRINKYLLEFISYQNRAWSRFSSTTFNMETDLVAFYEQIKDPVLVDVRYLLVGTDREEVYPKYLSDFYHGKPLEIYGKYDEEDKFSMQVLGRALNGTKEIIFEKSFKNADIGSQEIARNWAFRKIYYLISRNTMGIGNPERLRKEIEVLSRKYGIMTPYDIKNGE